MGAWEQGARELEREGEVEWTTWPVLGCQSLERLQPVSFANNVPREEWPPCLAHMPKHNKRAKDWWIKKKVMAHVH